MKIFISIATYNEKENIEKLINDIFALQIDNLNIIVTDDNSPDGTAEIVEKMKASLPFLHLNKRSGKLGYGSAHISGFKKALAQGADIVISMDADFSHDPKKIPEMIEQIKNGNDVAVGSRKIQGGDVVDWSLWRKFCSGGAMMASKIMLNIKTRDLTSGFRAYRKQVLETVDLDKIKSNGYSFLEEMIYKIEKKGFKVREIPIIFHDRRLGQSKLSKMEIVKFFATIFKLRFWSLKEFRFNAENITFLALIISFFVGLWHAFPMLNVVADEMYFVGGVLRAMESFSLLPLAGDVPYGTLTYLLNYFLIAVFLILALPFFGFNVSALKEYLVQSPEIVYYIPRFLSGLLALVYLFIINKIFKSEIKDKKVRILLLILIFANMLTVSIMHTGKMWVLSTLLVVVSFYFLYLAFNFKKETDHPAELSRNIFLSVLFGFLALANFPLNAFALINIPIILFYFREREVRMKLIKAVIIGAIIFVVLALSNFDGIKNQVTSIFTDYRPIGVAVEDNTSVGQSFLLYTQKVIAGYALMILVFLIAIFDGIRNKKLFYLSLSYFAFYFLTISILATWPHNMYAYFRYIYPLGFFLIFMVASLNITFKKIFYLIGLAGVVWWGFTLYFLSAPTTYNQARDWVIDNLNQEGLVIENQVNYLVLPKNKESYLMTQEYFCASKCKNAIENDLNNFFEPVIVDKYSQEAIASNYLITTEENNNLELIKIFDNGVENAYAVDGRMHSYFDLEFFQLDRLGPDIYIYKL